jgi:TRAP-type mannitol/chloroaromatic compound transport system permease small subunit
MTVSIDEIYKTYKLSCSALITLLCCVYQVQQATAADVHKAVQAAKVAFESGEWSKMNARDRGLIMYR